MYNLHGFPIYVHAYMNTYTWWFSMFEIIDPVWNHGPSGLRKRMIEDRFWSKNHVMPLRLKKINVSVSSFLSAPSFWQKNWTLHLLPLENIVTPRVQWMRVLTISPKPLCYQWPTSHRTIKSLRLETTWTQIWPSLGVKNTRCLFQKVFLLAL